MTLKGTSGQNDTYFLLPAGYHKRGTLNYCVRVDL